MDPFYIVPAQGKYFDAGLWRSLSIIVVSKIFNLVWYKHSQNNKQNLTVCK
jgi:hypothetical protein